MSGDWRADVLKFWFGLEPKQWWSGGPELDHRIKQDFIKLWFEKRQLPLDAFLTDPLTAIAAVILFDQFPRNMFRGDKLAFATDPLARAIAAGAIVRGFDSQVSPDLRSFFYLPFEHSEDLADQERGIAFYKAAGDTENLKWAEIHADIIRRFGRFPHRNALLGRTTTPEEQAFLDGGGFAG